MHLLEGQPQCPGHLISISLHAQLICSLLVVQHRAVELQPLPTYHSQLLPELPFQGYDMPFPQPQLI